MHILITGGAGYIGSHFVLQLTEAGHSAIVYDSLATGFDWTVPEGSLRRGDLADQDLLDSVMAEERFDAVVHFAANLIVPESVEEPLKYYRNNAMNTLGLLEVCAGRGVERLIFSSSAAVYGSPADSPIGEGAPIAPINPYGASKAMSERMIMDQAAVSGLRYVILRYFNVAGAEAQGRLGQNTAKATHLIQVACQAAMGRRAGLQVFGSDYPTRDGTCIRDYLHVDDLARAHIDSLGYLAAGGASQVFNCGYGHGASVLDVVETVKRVSAADFPVEMAERRVGDPAELVADNSKIRSLLDWTPRHDDLEFIVTTALNWERGKRTAG